ncbi:MAG: porin [Afipia sp.]
MSKIKSLILGSAAGLVAIGGAQAADLPLKAKAVEYVKVCSLYGAGFYYIPGTDTCIKLGGYLRVDIGALATASHGPYWSGAGGQGNRYADNYTFRSRMAVTVDTRTATEYGVVRTFGQGDFTFDSRNGGATAWDPVNTPASGTFAVENAFVQFAGFTFGKSASVYSTPWHSVPGNYSVFLLGTEDSVTGVNNIHYTWDFGNGFSASLGVDEGGAYSRTTLANLNTSNPTAIGGLSQGYAGLAAPDIVGNMKLDQAWGLIQFSAAAHNLHAGYYTANLETSGHPSDTWGFAVQGALQLKNLPTGPGDDIKFVAGYADGATKYIIGTAVTSPNFAVFGGGDGLAYQSIGFGSTTDGVFGLNGSIEKTKAWGVSGAFAHNWNPNWQTTVFGGYASVSYNDNAKTLYCGGYGATVAGQGVSYTCNPDFSVAQIGTRTTWTPVKNLTLGAEVMYSHLDQNFTGSAVMSPGGTKPAATTYNFKDQNVVSGMFRIQRNF